MAWSGSHGGRFVGALLESALDLQATARSGTGIAAQNGICCQWSDEGGHPEVVEAFVRQPPGLRSGGGIRGDRIVAQSRGGSRIVCVDDIIRRELNGAVGLRWPRAVRFRGLRCRIRSGNAAPSSPTRGVAAVVLAQRPTRRKVPDVIVTAPVLVFGITIIRRGLSDERIDAVLQLRVPRVPIEELEKQLCLGKICPD